MGKDEFAPGESAEPRKIIIEDRRVSRQEDAGPAEAAEPAPDAAKRARQKQAPAGPRTKAAPAGEAAGTPEEEAQREFAALYEAGIEGFLQYNLGIILQLAYIYLGLIVNPATGLVARDLARAKLCIDVFEYLTERLKEHLPPQVRDELARLGKDLKLNFINVASSPPPPAPDKEKPQGA